MKPILTTLLLLLTLIAGAQTSTLQDLSFLQGSWKGTGTGFGNSTSKITATYNFIMKNRYIEVKHESVFKPTAEKPQGDHHIDRGYISFDKARNIIIYRQFNSEGYINQYILNETLSTADVFVFETEHIENFVPGGKARLTIKRINATSIETVFDVSFPNKEYTCFGTNKLTLIEN